MHYTFLLQISVVLRKRLSAPGHYVLVVEYASEEELTQTLSVAVNMPRARTHQHRVTLLHCKYRYEECGLSWFPVYCYCQHFLITSCPCVCVASCVESRPLMNTTEWPSSPSLLTVRSSSSLTGPASFWWDRMLAFGKWSSEYQGCSPFIHHSMKYLRKSNQISIIDLQ